MANQRGRLAVLRPADTNEAELYPVPGSTEIDALLRICNQDTSARTYRVAHTDASGAAASEDWLVYDKSISANDTHELSIHAKNSEYIRVKASSSNVLVFGLSGNKIT